MGLLSTLPTTKGSLKTNEAGFNKTEPKIRFQAAFAL